jgi:hypothetical protein
MQTDMPRHVRVKLIALTAADPYSAYPVDLLNDLGRECGRARRLPRRYVSVNASLAEHLEAEADSEFVRHMHLLWDAEDLLTAHYGVVTPALVRSLAANFGETVRVKDLRNGDVFEDGGWIGGGPPHRVVAWSVAPDADAGYVTVWLHMTGTGRRFRSGATVHVLERGDPAPGSPPPFDEDELSK